MSESAWKWGAYKEGMGLDTDDRRIRYACGAIKHRLVALGYGGGINLTGTYFGGKTTAAARAFQKSEGLVVDGLVGPKTCNALWRGLIWANEVSLPHIPDDWLRAQIHWESADDPGAEFLNPDGSRDRGLIQSNDGSDALTDDEAYDPAASIPFLARFLREGAKRYAGCQVDRWNLAVARWRTPVGADGWCDAPDTQPNKDGTWPERAAYYVSRVDTDGRRGWIG